MIDRNSYEILWNKGIREAIRRYQDMYSGITMAPDAKELIWNEYCRFNEQCKKTYMSDSNAKIDRHKVCACYIYAIVKAHVIDCTLFEDSEDRFLLANEFIAISVGLSLLRAFIIHNANTNEMPAEKKKITIRRVLEGIVIPECNHGDYLTNFATELYYTRKDENYNILALAHALFLLEIHSIETEVLKDRKRKKTKKKKR